MRPGHGLRSAELRASLLKLGIEARPHTPQELAAALGGQAQKYDPIVRSTGIKVE
jgi:tripartite-type tricarboxylate transporter receptor subunit TctC